MMIPIDGNLDANDGIGRDDVVGRHDEPGTKGSLIRRQIVYSARSKLPDQTKTRRGRGEKNNREEEGGTERRRNRQNEGNQI